LGYHFDGIKVATVAFYGVACRSARSCRVTGYAGGKGVIMLTDGQRNWQQEPTPNLKGIGLGQIACPRPDVCYIVGSGGVILKGS